MDEDSSIRTLAVPLLVTSSLTYCEPNSFFDLTVMSLVWPVGARNVPEGGLDDGEEHGEG